MIDSVIFIATVIAAIIAVTQFIKFLSPQVRGAITIVVAIVVGIVVAILDTHIGVNDISIAQGILIGLAAVGVSTVAKV